MALNIALKSPRCIGRSFFSAALRPSRSSARIISRHRENSIGVEKHVFGAAKSDAFRAEFSCGRAIGRCLRICSNFHAPFLVRPHHELCKVTGEFRMAHRNAAAIDFTGRAIDGHNFAAREHQITDRHRTLHRIDL